LKIKQKNLQGEIASKFNKNIEAVKEEYHNTQADYSTNIVDEAIHKKDALASKMDKNKEAIKEQYYKH